MATTRTWTGWLATLLLLGAAVVPVGPAVADEPDAVIVWGDSSDAAADAVDGLGGEVTTTLPLIGAVAADLDAAAVRTLEGSTDLQVVPDRPLEFQSNGDTGSEPTSSDRLQLDGSSPPDHWSMETGGGVGVALIDTGVDEHDDLEGRVYRHDLTEDGGEGYDEYGHGTFMAGLIAGDGTSGSGGPTGLAPGANVISVKVADGSGATSLSRVLEAIGWVIVNQDEYGIRVLNLSIGVPTSVSPQADPLVAAVQTAWASGITVVAAAGNEGEASGNRDGDVEADGKGNGNGAGQANGNGQGQVTSPGRDPYAITVGSLYSDQAAVGEFEVPAWSSQGRVTSTDKPELLAPGTSVVSLRATGSSVDEDHPDARVDDHYFRGTGTSMSAALVSGAAAALLEMRGFATPDDVKGALVSGGHPVDGAQGRALDLAQADEIGPDQAWRQQHPTSFVAPPGESSNRMPWAADDAPTVEETWQRVRWMDGDWQRVRWMDGEWQRVRWMSDGDWQRVRWMDDSFQRVRWMDDGDWQRVRWMDASFQRVRWMDDNFARVRWMDDGQWARVRWMDGDWQRVRWMDSDWQRVRWMDDAWPDAAWSAAGWGDSPRSDPPAP